MIVLMQAKAQLLHTPILQGLTGPLNATLELRVWRRLLQQMFPQFEKSPSVQSRNVASSHFRAGCRQVRMRQ
ncbi:hypothetical protein X743_06325 [Mesorhizobium sp. LNHC252B00]|nr:hypothetical protein X743_06325 [Mesorhizobium sp. LNHC252B00]